MLNYLRERLGFYAYRATTQSIPDSDPTTVIFSTVVYNDGSNYDNSTGIYTCPLDGLYVCNWLVGLSSATWGVGDVMGAHLSRNGTTSNSYGNLWRGMRTQSQVSHSRYATSRGSIVVQAEEGDTLDVFVYQSQGGAVDVNADGQKNHFSVGYWGVA